MYGTSMFVFCNSEYRRKITEKRIQKKEKKMSDNSQLFWLFFCNFQCLLALLGFSSQYISLPHISIEASSLWGTRNIIHLDNIFSSPNSEIEKKFCLKMINGIILRLCREAFEVNVVISKREKSGRQKWKISPHILWDTKMSQR